MTLRESARHKCGPYIYIFCAVRSSDTRTTPYDPQTAKNEGYSPMSPSIVEPLHQTRLDFTRRHTHLYLLFSLIMSALTYTADHS